MGEHGKPVPILGVEQGQRPAKDMAINRAEPRCGRLSGGPVRVDGFGWSCSGSGQQTIDRQAQDRGDAEQHQHEQPWRDVVQHGFSSAFRDPFVLRLDRFRRPESLPRSFGSSPMSWRPPTTLFPQPSGLPFHCRMRKSRARLQLKNIAIFRTKTGLGSTFTKGGPRNPAGHSTSDNKSRHLACNRPNISNPSPESPSLSPIPGADVRRGASRQAACPRCRGFVVHEPGLADAWWRLWIARCVNCGWMRIDLCEPALRAPRPRREASGGDVVGRRLALHSITEGRSMPHPTPDRSPESVRTLPRRGLPARSAGHR